MQAKLLILLLVNTVCLLNADQVPVLSYFSANHPTDSITIGKVVHSADFLDQVKNFIKPNLDVILVEKLNTQDISLKQRNFDFKDNVVFEPQVESPFQVLDKYIKQHDIKVNLHEFKDIDDALASFNNIHQTSNGVILTGVHSHKFDSRVKRAIDEQINDNEKQKADRDSNSTTYVFGEQCAAFFDQVYFIDQSNLQTSNYVYLPIMNSTNTFTCNDSNGTQTLSINFNSNSGIKGASVQQMNLMFKKSFNNRYYVLQNSSLILNTSNELSLVYMGAPYGMETPIDFSFVCTKTSFKVQNTTADSKSNLKIWFYIENLQFQPLGMMANSSNYTFGPINYCQGFFSSGIWMAISASLILTFILAFGVSLLFNVKTMDRFDDPKGKPLNIGAEK